MCFAEQPVRRILEIVLCSDLLSAAGFRGAKQGLLSGKGGLFHLACSVLSSGSIL